MLISSKPHQIGTWHLDVKHTYANILSLKITSVSVIGYVRTKHRERVMKRVVTTFVQITKLQKTKVV